MATFRARRAKGFLFVDGTSFVHRANPLTTLVATIWAISLASILPTVPAGLFALAIVGFAVAAGIGPITAKRLAFTMVPFGIALFLVHVMLLRSPDAVHLGPLAFSASGFADASLLFCRLGAMIAASLVFVATTHPSGMLKSLDARGVSPVISYLIASPLLLLEPLMLRAESIRDAQQARGMDLTGSLRARILAVPALLIPLIALAFSDLDHRVVVLTGRAFRGRKRRTVLDGPGDDAAQNALRVVLLIAAIAQIGVPLLWR